MIVGLTGGIATGKSVVSDLWERKRAFVIRADEIGHELLRREYIKKMIMEKFGGEVFNEKGDVDRKKLGKVVFSSREKLELLNSIMHPPMVKLILQRLEESGAKLKVVEAAVLYEMGLDKACDKIVLVFCSKQKQLERLLEKGLDRVSALERINSQRDYSKLLSEVDYVIHTEGSLEETIRQAEEVFNKLLKEGKEVKSEFSEK